MNVPATLDIVVILVLMLAVGGAVAAWGIYYLQSERSWIGGVVAALGVLIAAYAPLCAMFGWPPVEWLRG